MKVPSARREHGMTRVQSQTAHQSGGEVQSTDEETDMQELGNKQRLPEQDSGKDPQILPGHMFWAQLPSR